MGYTHDTIIYTVVGIIICVQLFFFLKNFKKILAYKHIIASNEKLSIVELNIEDDKASTLDPEYFLENKRFYENTEMVDFIDDMEESDENELQEENEDDDQDEDENFA